MAPRRPTTVALVCLWCCCCLMVLTLLHAPGTAALPFIADNQVSEQQIFETMRNIPQWHCLRYRRFDLVRRCRHMRGPRRHA